MGELLRRLQTFFSEARRRNVYRVAATYALAGFVAVQVADLTFVRLGLPSWTVTFVIALVAVGFPLALVLAWAFEMTPQGVRRTRSAGPAAERPAAATDGAGAGYGALVALGLLAAAAVGGWYLTGGGGEAPRAGERSIAVLPFEQLGAEEATPFTEGMHDALLTRLSNVSGLAVISRTSVQRYRDSDEALPEIARELGVRWVLEGGVQEVGERIRVNAQLIDPRTDTHAWADDYERDLTAENLFAIQSELTKKIAGSLEAELTTGERERVERRPTEDLEAYRLYLQGRTHLEERTEGGMRRSLEYFHRAIERDSTYALAWSGVADARALLASYRYAPRDSMRREALAAARRALAIDPELAEAHASLGLLHQMRRDAPAAARELRSALELKPSYARAHHWLGLVLVATGRLEEAIASIERAAELDPMSPSIQVALSGAYGDAGRPEEALEAARRAEELAPEYPSGPQYAGSALLEMGRYREAISVLEELAARPGTPPGVAAGSRAMLAVAHHRLGDAERARDLLAEVRSGWDVPFIEGVVYAQLGEPDSAFAALRRAEYDYWRAGMLRDDPLLGPVREDPRFRGIVREVNRSWGLEPDGSFPGEGR